MMLSIARSIGFGLIVIGLVVTALGASRPTLAARGASASTASPLAGTWRRLPPTPIAPDGDVTGVWAGRHMLVFGRRYVTALDARGNPYIVKSVDVAAAYNPASERWRRLAPWMGPTGSYQGRYKTVWTGREMLVFGPFDFQAFNPATNRWRRLPAERGGGAGGLLAWSGHELVDWGGGCCGDASSGGGAYNPSTNKWRKLAPSPLAPSQGPIGAWTGRELIILVSGLDPDGKEYPTSFARAAAYNPATDTWHRIARPPVSGGTAVWGGRELLVIGGGATGRSALAYDPAANRWQRLTPLPSRRSAAATVWTGSQLLLWGGSETAGAGTPVMPSRGLAFSRQADRWSVLPRAPLTGRLDPAAVWSGRAMIVWGGSRPKRPLGTGTEFLAGGAAFTPATR
jgi:hypothetical protein